MDEEITIIDTKTRNEKVKNFIIDNKRNTLVFRKPFYLFLVILFLENKKKK